MTFEAAIARSRKRFGFFIQIAGIPRVWKTHAGIDASTILGETYAESTGISANLFSHGEETLDYAERCVKGGGLNFTIVEKRGTTVVRDLVQPRKRRSTYVASLINFGDVDGVFGDTAFASAPGVFYVGSETIKYTSVDSSTELSGFTRGAYGSREDSHEAATSLDGEAVYTVPPSWRGRRVQLWMVAIDVDGISIASEAKKIGTYSLDGAPKLRGLRNWIVSCSPLSDEYARAKLYSGLKEVKVQTQTVPRDPSEPGDSYLVALDDNETEAEQFTTGTFPTFVLLKIGDNSDPHALGAAKRSAAMLLRNEGVVGGSVLGVREPFLMTPAFGPGELAGLAVDSLRHVAIIGGTGTSQPILTLLHSKHGDGTNGVYDRLPGFTRAGMEKRSWRMGAALDEDDVDQESFDITSENWTFPLFKETEAQDVLRDWCWGADAFWYVNENQQLAAKRLTNDGADTVLTIDRSMLSSTDGVGVDVDEESIHPSVQFLVNYDPLEDRYIVNSTSVDGELRKRFPARDETFVVESKGITVNEQTVYGDLGFHYAFPGQMTQPELETYARRFQKNGGRGRLLIRVTCRISSIVARVGDTVDVELPDYPDLAGGVLTGRVARIVGRTPHLADGTVTFTLDVLERLFLVAPSAVIVARSTVSVANDTYELLTTDPAASGATPQNDFVVGCKVRIWDVSAGTSTTATVAQILTAPPRLRFTAAVAAPEANRDWLTWDTLGQNTAAGAAANGHDEDDLLFMMPNDPTAPNAGEERRWQ